MWSKHEYDISLPCVLERKFGLWQNRYRLIDLMTGNYSTVRTLSGGNQVAKVFVDKFYDRVMLVYENYLVECGSLRNPRAEKLGKLPIEKGKDIHIVAGLPHTQTIWIADQQEVFIARRKQKGWELDKSDLPYYPVSTGSITTSFSDKLTLYSEKDRLGVLVNSHTQHKAIAEADGFGCPAMPTPCWYRVVPSENITRFSVFGTDKEFGSFVVGHPNRNLGKAVVSREYACLLLYHPGSRGFVDTTLIAFFTLSGYPVWGGFVSGTPGQIFLWNKRAWICFTKESTDCQVYWQIYEFNLEYGYKQSWSLCDCAGKPARKVELWMADYNIESAKSARENNGVIFVFSGENKYALLPPEIPLESNRISGGFVPIKFVLSQFPH